MVGKVELRATEWLSEAWDASVSLLDPKDAVEFSLSLFLDVCSSVFCLIFLFNLLKIDSNVLFLSLLASFLFYIF